MSIHDFYTFYKETSIYPTRLVESSSEALKVGGERNPIAWSAVQWTGIRRTLWWHATDPTWNSNMRVVTSPGRTGHTPRRPTHVPRHPTHTPR
jgi:hypothetical protein